MTYSHAVLESIGFPRSTHGSLASSWPTHSKWRPMGVQTVGIAPSPAAMTAEISYGTTVVRMASLSRTAGGGGCVGNPEGGGDTFPEMPMVDEPGTGCIP